MQSILDFSLKNGSDYLFAIRFPITVCGFKASARSLIAGLLTGVALSITTATTGHANEATDLQCPPVGVWVNPATGKRIATPDLIRETSKRPVVLLGESHTSFEHHRWQLQVIAALYGNNPNMVIGFEAFPQNVQSVLDQWVQGDLSEKEFFEKSRWFDVWKYDPALYMPLFHFARMNRIPMRALNATRALTQRVSQEGWTSIPADERDGISTPAAPSPDYLAILRAVYESHTDDPSTVDETKFERFVQVQLTWDRAMAEALARATTLSGAPLVVGIVGRGHVEYRHGIPHQLDDLGVRKSAVLLPMDAGSPCVKDPTADSPDNPIANALFGVLAPVAQEEPPHQLLGVQVETVDLADGKAVRIIKVVEGSIAETAGLRDDDLIVRAADRDITSTSELIKTVRRQAPGTWLPLVIQRQDERLDIVARFPAQP